MDESAHDDREKPVNFWRNRLDDVRLRLDQARSSAKAAEDDWRTGTIPPPDGNFAYQRALRAERDALAEYRRVLTVFIDVVLSHRIRDEGKSRMGAPSATRVNS